MAVASIVPWGRGCRTSDPGQGWPASLRRGPGSLVCSAGGLAGGGLEVGQSQCHYQAALDRVLCVPCKPHGEKSKEVPPPGLPFRQTDNKHMRMEGQSLAQGHVNLETLSQQPTPPCSRTPSAARAAGASSRWPGLTMNPCRSALGRRGVSPLGSALHHPGSSSGPSGHPHAGSGGRWEPCVPPSAARVFASRTPGRLLGSPGHAPCSDVGPWGSHTHVPPGACSPGLGTPSPVGWFPGAPPPGLVSESLGSAEFQDDPTLDVGM